MRLPPIRLTVLALMLAVAPAATAQDRDAPPMQVASTAGPLKVEQLATLEFPWGLARLPDGRVLVTEKPGRLRIWNKGRLSKPVEGVPEVAWPKPGDQGGLLDVEPDPDFARNGLIYLSYVEAADPQPPGLKETEDIRFGDYIDTSDTVLRGGAVARARLDGERLRDLEVIWRQEPKTVGRGHFGHRLLFGPDGKLYITSGERMRFDPAQELSSNLGKVVRINPDGSLPADNPFAGKPDARGDLWSVGHRNILATAFDAKGRLWAFEMGPLGGDEVNLVRAGRNYGWPIASNGDNYAGPSIPDHPTQPDYQAPVRTWTPVVSPSGAIFYDGAMFPAWRGNALVGGLSSQGLVRLTFDGERIAVEERIDMQRRIRDVMQADDGALYVIVDAKDGGLLRLTPAPAAPQR